MRSGVAGLEDRREMCKYLSPLLTRRTVDRSSLVILGSPGPLPLSSTCNGDGDDACHAKETEDDGLEILGRGGAEGGGGGGMGDDQQDISNLNCPVMHAY
ncbi:hypothetical protein PG993_005654 [Apiospora rasikravindrae]|uniref:Uncharacterized protein n=1 Tax=Apiospora rasikravindrae TaxID=990691 RepID=A0ABR1TG75_9PEZI